MRYEFFGWPTELDGRIGNVDFEAITNTENPVNAFIVPKNVQNTGFAAVDAAIATSERADNNHTLKGNDWNNVAPRVGFAWRPGPQRRGSCAAATGSSTTGRRRRSSTRCFRNYPFLREVEVTVPSRAVPMTRAFSQQNPHVPVQPVPAQPYRPHERAAERHLSDSRRHAGDRAAPTARSNPIDPATGQPVRGNVAETFEFRAIDRDLEAP